MYINYTCKHKFLLRFDAILSQVGQICFLNAALRWHHRKPTADSFSSLGTAWRAGNATTFKWGLSVVVLAASWHSKGEKLPQEDADEEVGGSLGGGGEAEGGIFERFWTWSGIQRFSDMTFSEFVFSTPPSHPASWTVLGFCWKTKMSASSRARRQIWNLATVKSVTRRRWRRGERRCSAAARTMKRQWSFCQKNNNNNYPVLFCFCNHDGSSIRGRHSLILQGLKQFLSFSADWRSFFSTYYHIVFQKDTDIVGWIQFESWRLCEFGKTDDQEPTQLTVLLRAFRQHLSGTNQMSLSFFSFLQGYFIVFSLGWKKETAWSATHFKCALMWQLLHRGPSVVLLLWALYIHVLVFSFFSLTLSLLIIQWRWEPPGRTTGSRLCSFELFIYYLLVFLEVSAPFEER